MKTGFELQLVELVKCDDELSKRISAALRELGIYSDVALVLRTEKTVGYLVLHHAAYVGGVAILDTFFRLVVNEEISSEDMLECYGGKTSNYYRLVHSCLKSAGYRISLKTDWELFPAGWWMER